MWRTHNATDLTFPKDQIAHPEKEEIAIFVQISIKNNQF